MYIPISQITENTKKHDYIYLSSLVSRLLPPPVISRLPTVAHPNHWNPAGEMHRYNTRSRNKRSSQGSAFGGSPLPTGSESLSSPPAATGKHVRFTPSVSGSDVAALVMTPQIPESTISVVPLPIASVSFTPAALEYPAKEIPPPEAPSMEWLPHTASVPSPSTTSTTRPLLPKLEINQPARTLSWTFYRQPTNSVIRLASTVPLFSPKLERTATAPPLCTLPFSFHRPPYIPASSSKTWTHARLTAIFGLSKSEFDSVLTVLSNYFEDHPFVKGNRSTLCAHLNTLLFPAPLVAKVRAVDQDGYLCYQLALAGKRKAEARAKSDKIVLLTRTVQDMADDMRKVKMELEIVQADVVAQSLALEMVRAEVRRVETDFNNRLEETLDVGKETNELVRQLLRKVM